MPIDNDTGAPDTEPLSPVADANPADVSNTQDVDPQSSGGKTDPQPDPGPKSLDEAITAALDQSEGTDTPGKTPDPDPKATDQSADKPADKEATPSDGTAEKGSDEAELSDEVSEEELRSYKGKPQKRIKQLLSQRNEYRRELEGLKPDADEYRKIKTFMDTNALVPDEVAGLLQAGADLKSGQPERLQRFLQLVQPLVDQVLELTGQTVPADLKPKVEQGEMTEDAAKTVARERAGRIAAENAAKAAGQQVQQTQQATVAAGIRNAVAGWEQQVRQSDPDFGKKAAAMARTARALVAERGQPKTPDEAVALAKAAYDEVTGWLKSVQPAPKPTQAAPSSGQSASRSGMSTAPKTLEEAINGAMRQATTP
jgi:hypothetical protein